MVCVAVALFITMVLLVCDGGSRPLTLEHDLPTLTVYWVVAVPVGVLWGVFRPLGRTPRGAAVLGAIVTPPSVFLTGYFVSDVPDPMAHVPVDLIATIIGGAVIGIGFFGIGMVLGIAADPFAPVPEEPPEDPLRTPTRNRPDGPGPVEDDD